MGWLRWRGGDEGSINVLMVTAVLCISALTLVVIKVAQGGDLRTRAQTGVDAAAIGALTPMQLASARMAVQGTDPTGIGLWATTGEEDAARRYADRNGVTVEGKPQPSGSLGRTMRVNGVTKDCQIIEEAKEIKGAVDCTDSRGEKGKGLRYRATAYARLIMPSCRYVYAPGSWGESGGAVPVRLVCGGQVVWERDKRPRPVGSVLRVFKIRLVNTGDGPYRGPVSPPDADFPPGKLPATCPEIVKRVLAYAKAQIGKPYVWGAEGPGAFDCSGLTMMSWRAGGIGIPRVTYDQVKIGPLFKSGEQPGDLVFLRPGPRGPEHVGLVYNPANKTMVEAQCTRCGPIAIKSYVRSNFIGFVRVPCGKRQA